jgi:hypothetical protein
MKTSISDIVLASALSTYQRHRLRCLQSEVMAEACRNRTQLSALSRHLRTPSLGSRQS